MLDTKHFEEFCFRRPTLILGQPGSAEQSARAAHLEESTLATVRKSISFTVKTFNLNDLDLEKVNGKS